MGTNVRLCLGLLVIAISACESAPRSAAFVAHDSAGVRVVEVVRPLWERGQGWTVSSDPEVAIGVAEGDERYLLSEVAGVRRLSDGRIAILDFGSDRVRVYDASGRHLMDLGGDGDGPSEFRYPQFLGVISDTLFVYEYVGGDLTWFTPNGELLRRFNAFRESGGERSTPLMLGYVEDRYAIGLKRARTLVLPPGLNREPLQIWRFGLVDSGEDSLFSVPGAHDMIISSTPTRTHHQTYVFGKYTTLAVSRDRIYVGPTDAFSIQAFDGDGALRQIIRRDDTPRRVTRANVRRRIEEQLELRGLPEDERAEMLRTAGDLSHAETMPAFRWIAVDSDDNLWVEEWEGVGVDQGSFSIFRPDGAWLGSVEVPDGLPESWGHFDKRLMEIGPDYLLGVWTDEYGVEQVRLYHIDKG